MYLYLFKKKKIHPPGEPQEHHLGEVQSTKNFSNKTKCMEGCKKIH